MKGNKKIKRFPNKVFLEKDGNDYYLGIPGILVNRINPNNLDNFLDPTKTWIKNAIEEMKSRLQKNIDIFNEAMEAGNNALKNKVPHPMVVQQHTNMLDPEGVCGFAWISLKSNTKENRAFLNDLKRAKIDAFKKSYYAGYQYWVSQGGQSLERKEAFAYAFWKVLRDNGITAYTGSRMD